MREKWVNECGEVCRSATGREVLFFVCICLLGCLAWVFFVIRILVGLGFVRLEGASL